MSEAKEPDKDLVERAKSLITNRKYVGHLLSKDIARLCQEVRDEEKQNSKQILIDANQEIKIQSEGIKYIGEQIPHTVGLMNENQRVEQELEKTRQELAEERVLEVRQLIKKGIKFLLINTEKGIYFDDAMDCFYKALRILQRRKKRRKKEKK